MFYSHLFNVFSKQLEVVRNAQQSGSCILEALIIKNRKRLNVVQYSMPNTDKQQITGKEFVANTSLPGREGHSTEY